MTVAASFGTSASDNFSNWTSLERHVYTRSIDESRFPKVDYKRGLVEISNLVAERDSN